MKNIEERESKKDKIIVYDLFKYINEFQKNNDFFSEVSSLMGYTFKDYTSLISIRYCNYWGNGKPSEKLNDSFSIEIYDKSDLLWYFCKKRFDINIQGRIKHYDFGSFETVYDNKDIYKKLMDFFENKIKKLNKIQKSNMFNQKSEKLQISKEWQKDTSSWD
jgi:hypothetical protein